MIGDGIAKFFLGQANYIHSLASATSLNYMRAGGTIIRLHSWGQYSLAPWGLTPPPNHQVYRYYSTCLLPLFILAAKMIPMVSEWYESYSSRVYVGPAVSTSYSMVWSETCRILNVTCRVKSLRPGFQVTTKLITKIVAFWGRIIVDL